MSYFPKLLNDVTSKEPHKTSSTPTVCNISDSKLIVLEKRLTGNPIEYWGHHYDWPPPKLFPYDHGEANVTCYRTEGTQGCGGIPLPHEDKVILAVRQNKYLGEP
jgi:hypothetical protein